MATQRLFACVSYETGLLKHMNNMESLSYRSQDTDLFKLRNVMGRDINQGINKIVYHLVAQYHTLLR